MVILTVEAIEDEARRQLEILERKLELMDAFRDNLITEQELDDALLLLSLVGAPPPGPSPHSGGGGKEGNDDGF